MFNRTEEQIGIIAIKIEIWERAFLTFFVSVGTTLSCHHPTTYIIIDGVIRCFSQLEIILIDHKATVRMGYIRAILVDDEVCASISPQLHDAASNGFV